VRNRTTYHLLIASLLISAVTGTSGNLEQEFVTPPDNARPGVYWYFMDGNLSREGMTKDLESMKAAGMGHVLFLEVNVGVPRGPVDFLSERWQELFAHAVRETERLGMELILGSGPGWTGSGGPWVKPEQSMQHLVASESHVKGPGKLAKPLPVPPPRRPFFGDVPRSLQAKWEGFYKDVAVLAFPTPSASQKIKDFDEKALVYRAPFSSQPGVKPRLDAPAEFPAIPAGGAVDRDQILDLTDKLQPDGSLDFEFGSGDWTVLRFVSRNNGATTRPAPEPGIGFECDKFDATALDAHFADYGEKLLKKLPDRKRDGRGWTMLHIDSWEMGAQNWSERLREEFKKRRGYDPKPFYPAWLGHIVDSQEVTERFLWDLRHTAQELVIENHAEHLKSLGRKHGFTLSIEPYDMNPVNDFDLGAVADVPMCEFWSLGFNTTFSCHTASSIAHVLGLPIVAAESFTADHGEAWKFHPGYLKNQGDWAFSTGINRFTFHTFAHKPDETRPGMVMGPYGVHWDRGQTWWPMVSAYHRYLSRCQHLLRQGRSVADMLYLIPEGAPNVFQPPASAFSGTVTLPERRGYNFDGCSALTLIDKATVREGRISFKNGGEYRLLVLPDCDTMTPELARKLQSLIKAGATVVGNPPVKSPSLVDYLACDANVEKIAREIWNIRGTPPAEGTRKYGKGRVIYGAELRDGSRDEAESNAAITGAHWIWNESNAANSAPTGKIFFRREFYVPANANVRSARIHITADNSFKATLNGSPVLDGGNFHQLFGADVQKFLRPEKNVLVVQAENAGDAANPAGLIAALTIENGGATEQLLTDKYWEVCTSLEKADWQPAVALGPREMAPWRLQLTTPPKPLYPHYNFTASVLREMGVPEDFSSDEPLRYAHRRTQDRDVYFVGNTSAARIEGTARFRASGTPELWDPINGTIRPLPQHKASAGVCEIPLQFQPYESCFVVFSRSSGSRNNAATSARNYPRFAEIQKLDNSWEVSFDPALGGPGLTEFSTLQDWITRPEPGVRHYSGIAVYKTTFDLRIPSGISWETLSLDLGNVQVVATVRVNDVDCGTLWTAPWRVKLPADHLKPTGNALEIRVANLWPNRMIGDDTLPGPKIAQTTYRPYKAGDPLLPSGLLGPVKLVEQQ
jgi:hypothetical protein